MNNQILTLIILFIGCGVHDPPSPPVQEPAIDHLCKADFNGTWNDQDIPGDTLTLNKDCSGTDSFCQTVFSYTLPVENKTTITITKSNAGTACLPLGTFQCKFTVTNATLAYDCGQGTLNFTK